MGFNQTGSNATANIGTYNDFSQSTDEIETLSFAHASRKDYQKRKKGGLCFEGTRVAVVGEMTDWITNPHGPRMYTLSGLAGIGKSTIAYTVATKADECGLLGASFFFTRDEIDCRTAHKFFTTFAYQLCQYDEEIKRSVLATEGGAAAAKGTPQEQLEALILDPLRGVSASRIQPVLIVVDALDECDIDDVPTILAGLRRLVQDLPSFKIILTTRPQPLVSHDLVTLGDHKIFHLQDIEDRVVNDDIRLYLKHSLSQEQVRVQLRDPEEHWYPSDAEIDSLVHAAGKLFIIASTAVRYILDRFWSDPAGRMRKLLLTASDQNHTPLDCLSPFDDLSRFYTIILRSAIPANCRDRSLVERYQMVIGTILLIQVPLSVDTLASITGIEARQISVVLRQLQSVIQVGTDNVPIIYHKSFSDFIIDSARCEDVNLRIDPTVRNTRIAIRCFEIMKGHLQYNILHLDGPARFMDNEKGLGHQRISDEDLKERISPGLQYTCVYWANHFQSAKIDDACLMEELETFANIHMLHWFEALSLIGKLDSARRSIRVALTLVKPTSSNLFQLLSDGLRFISKFYEVIERSALHTYYSALPFTPTESLLYRRYSKEATDGIFRVVVRPEEWDALIATQTHGSRDDQKRHVKFSLDSTLFATWDHKSVRFWDAATGTPISTIPCNSSYATIPDDDDINVAIANDFSTVALAEDDAITLYSIKTSTPLATFATLEKILGLALSSEIDRVAALLSDGTLCLWDIGKREQIASFGGFDTIRYILTFSPTGARLVCLSCDDNIIQLRDGITGTVIADLSDQSGVLHEPVFSNDNSRFAVLTIKALRLFRSEGGELLAAVAVPLSTSQSPKLAITVDGSLLAIGTGSKVQLWSGNGGGHLTLIDKEEFGFWVDSLAFSPDDKLILSTSSNIMVYDVGSRSVISTLPIHTQGSTLMLSPDGSRLAAITLDGIVYLWDVQVIRTSSTKEAKHIRDLAVPQSCARIACVFKDHAIELWEIGATKRKVRIHGGRDDKDYRGIRSIGLSPDGEKLAAIFYDGTIKLWDGKNGTPIESIKQFSLEKIALSNRMLAAAGSGVLAVWDLGTLLPMGPNVYHNLSNLTFSGTGNLLAFSHWYKKSSLEPWSGIRDTVTVLGVLNHTVIATFKVHDYIDKMTFLSDESQLVVQFEKRGFQSFNLVSKEVTHRPTFNHLIHQRYFPLWHAVSLSRRLECYCLVRLFPQHEGPVPVIWIPRELQIVAWGQESSMIACSNGPVIFVPSPI